MRTGGGRPARLAAASFADRRQRFPRRDPRSAPYPRRQQRRAPFARRARSAGRGPLARAPAGAGRRLGFLLQAQQVAAGGLARVAAQHLLDAGQGGLAGLVRALGRGLPRAAAAHRHQLVDPAQGGVAVGGDQARADAPRVDGRPLPAQLLDARLVQVAGHHDAGGLQARRVQPLPHRAAQAAQIAAVQAHAEAAAAARLQVAQHRDRMRNPAVQRVVGVHQQDRPFRVELGEAGERGPLVAEGLHPGVGHGAAHRDAVALPGGDVGGAVHAADVGGTGRRQRPVQPLGAAQPELVHAPAGRRLHHPRRLGGDQGLEVDHVEQQALQELRLGEARGHPQQRLAGEHRRPLRRRVQRAPKPPPLQEAQELRAKRPQPLQVLQLTGVEAQRRGRVDHVLQARGQRVGAAERRPPEEQLEGDLGVVALQEVALHHGELVQVGGERGDHAGCFGQVMRTPAARISATARCTLPGGRSTPRQAPVSTSTANPSRAASRAE